MSQITVRVVYPTALPARMWLADKLFRLGAFVVGVNVEIEHE